MDEKRALSQTTNGAAHLYSEDGYAHFSQITESNKSLFPLLERAHPLTYTLHPGDALYIPPKWWHWVKSYGNRCLSVNYWFSRPLSATPIIFSGLCSDWSALQKWTNQYLIEVAEKSAPDGIWVWQEGFALKKKISMREFIDTYEGKKDVFAYLITLKAYEHESTLSNRRLLDQLEKDLEFPESIFERTKGKAQETTDHSQSEEKNPHPSHEMNVWFNFGGIDTGLHYDDSDGLLCVVDGMKVVTLYPPEDSQYLYPYPQEPITLQPITTRFMYNLYSELFPLPENVGITSSKLLEITLKRAPTLAAYTQKLQSRFGVGKIVYGIKNDQGCIKWEYYFYGTDRNCKTSNDPALLFRDPKYNSELALENYLAFHSQELRTVFPNDLAKDIPRTRLTVYSVDFDEESVITGVFHKLNLYYVVSGKIGVPFFLREDSCSLAGEIEIKSVQNICMFQDVFADTEIFLRKLEVIGILGQDALNILNFCNGREKCTSVSLVNKGLEVGIYFFGVTVVTFMAFLLEYCYPPELITLCAKNLESLAHMELEIGFHFKKGQLTSVPNRTAFYGLF